jgi:CheY-like chemotaxis protein
MASLEGLKVLVVDDDFLTLEFLEFLFADERASMKKASSVAQALEILGSWSPDIVISDIGLPGEDGLSFIGKLKSQEKTKHIPVLALTGYSSGVDRARLQNAGYKRVLIKPVEPEALLSAVEQIAGTSQKTPK